MVRFLVLRYFFPAEYDVDDFEPFVHNVDDALLMTAAEAIQEFHRELMQVNSPHGIQADHSFAFRLLEYGRHRASTLQRLGMLDAIVREEAPMDDREAAVRAAFELGMATAEHRIFHLRRLLPRRSCVGGVARKELQKPEKSDFAKEYGHDPASEKPQRSCTKGSDALPQQLGNCSAYSERMQLPELQKGRGTQLELDCDYDTFAH